VIFGVKGEGAGETAEAGAGGEMSPV